MKSSSAPKAWDRYQSQMLMSGLPGTASSPTLSLLVRKMGIMISSLPCSGKDKRQNGSVQDKLGSLIQM